MAFDLKKEFKEYYRPKNKPEIINVPSFNFISIRGKGILMKKTGVINKPFKYFMQ